MHPTVSEIYHKFESDGLTLLTGTGGLNNPVASCGILDYEYEEGVVEKYSRIHFRKNQLILTSFFYAKDNEFLISKAIKTLKQRGCSGLIVRNVFHLAIRENIIRYADSIGFPIFVLNQSKIYFEDLIVAVHELNKSYKSMYSYEDKINYLLAHPDDLQIQLKTITDINPSFESDILTIYFKGKKEFSAKEYVQMEKRFYESNILKNSDTMFYYKNGFMIICTRQMFYGNMIQPLVSSYLSLLSDDHTSFHIGVSSLFHAITDLPSSITESLYSCSFHAEVRKDFVTYEDLGVYQVIIPYVNDEVMKSFLDQYLNPLKDYDAEYQTNLFETALEYVQHHGNILETAQAFNQHKNTIRYRLNKISQVLDCNIIAKENYEKLMIAVRIHICKNTLDTNRHK